MKTKKLYIPHSPSTKSKLSGRWFKSIKNTSSIGGKIVANVFGDTQKDAEALAKTLVELFNKNIND